jgi:tetratricopeptide (TPR) repeat protein
VFISYSHADRSVVDRLVTHLRWLEHDKRLTIFDDGKLTGGEKWEERLAGGIAKADIIILAVTADFTASHYCTQVELKQALARAEARDICLLPILVAPCDWEAMPITDRQALPKDARLRLRALVKWGAAGSPGREEAFTQVAKHVRKNVDAIAAKFAASVSFPADPSPSPDRSLSRRGWRRPDAPDRFVGRADDLDLLLAALTTEPCRPIAVYGGAGMGKSTLTCAAANHPAVVARFGDRRAWVTLDRATDPAGMMAALLDALALPTGAEPLPAVAGELAAAPALLVLDNLETPWAHHRREIEELLGKLARVSGLTLMVSLRSGTPPPRPHWGTRLEVLRLTAPADLELLLAIATDVPRGDPRLSDVLAALDGWPLAIELFAEQAAGLGGLDLPWSLWCERRRRLVAESEGEPDPLGVSLAASLESPLLKLEPPLPANGARQLYALMGRLPDGLARRDAETILPGCGDAAAACLLRVRLVHPDGPRLRMLVPVREHAARSGLADGNMDAAHAHYLGLAAELRRYFAGDDRGVELTRLRAELVNLEALTASLIDLRISADSTDRQREIGSLCTAIGDARMEAGQLPLAALNYTNAKNVLLALTSHAPSNAQWQRNLSVSWNKLGDVRTAQGNLPGALQAFTEAKNIADRLATADPGSPELQRDLSIGWEKLGDVRTAQGDLPGALQAFTEAKNIRDRLATADPSNTLWQRDVYSVLWRIGNVKQAHGNIAEALTSVATGHSIIAKLAAADPANATWQRDVCVGWGKLGDVRSGQGELPSALQAFTEAMSIADRLATTDPANAIWQRDLVVAHWKVADLLERIPDLATDAAGHWAQALAIARTLADTGRLAPTDAYFVETLQERLDAAVQEPSSAP